MGSWPRHRHNGGRGHTESRGHLLGAHVFNDVRERHTRNEHVAGAGQRSQLRKRRADAGGHVAVVLMRRRGRHRLEHRSAPSVSAGASSPRAKGAGIGASGPLLGVQATRRKPNRSASHRPTARRLSQRPSRYTLVATRRLRGIPNKRLGNRSHHAGCTVSGTGEAADGEWVDDGDELSGRRRNGAWARAARQRRGGRDLGH